MMRQEVAGVRRLKAAVPDIGQMAMMCAALPPLNNNIALREDQGTHEHS